jgi:membrane associated rhomboid family serine protease
MKTQLAYSLYISSSMSGIAKHRILFQELFPFTFVLLIWLIQLAQGFLETNWGIYAVYPRTLSGLLGIFTSPLLHAGWEHLLGNTVPLLVLGFLLFNSYKGISGKVFWFIYLLNGVLLWLFAREAIHLGASGVIYGLASFLFFSGFVRKNPQLGMISLLIVFLYGSMVWGIFPFDPQVSWEAHLYGAITGLMLAIVLRKQGPQPVQYWADEEEEGIVNENESMEIPVLPVNTETHNSSTTTTASNEVPIIYIYRDQQSSDLSTDKTDT